MEIRARTREAAPSTSVIGGDFRHRRVLVPVVLDERPAARVVGEQRSLLKWSVLLPWPPCWLDAPAGCAR